MNEENMLKLYETLDEAVQTLQKEISEPYLDSLGNSMEMLFFNDIQQELSPTIKSEVRQVLEKIHLDDYSNEEIRRAIQLIILKGMQKSTQHQHVITPDTIALFIGYLADKLFADKKDLRIFDPVSGTGNLILTVMDYLKQTEAAYACEIDQTLIRISVMYANFMQSQIEFFHQDSLQPFLLDPVDLVVADLPVGYYPDDEQARKYELKASEGHSYAHYLLIEQSLHYTKPSGFLIMLIPETLFSDEKSTALHTFFHKHAHIIGLIQLDEATFKAKQHRKSILILQKKGNVTNDVKQPLLAKLPSFKNTNAMQDIMVKINDWFKNADI